MSEPVATVSVDLAGVLAAFHVAQLRCILVTGDARDTPAPPHRILLPRDPDQRERLARVLAGWLPGLAIELPRSPSPTDHWTFGTRSGPVTLVWEVAGAGDHAAVAPHTRPMRVGDTTVLRLALIDLVAGPPRARE